MVRNQVCSYCKKEISRGGVQDQALGKIFCDTNCGTWYTIKTNRPLTLIALPEGKLESLSEMGSMKDPLKP